MIRQVEIEDHEIRRSACASAQALGAARRLAAHDAAVPRQADL
jgi:hypothetical protein